MHLHTQKKKGNQLIHEFFGIVNEKWILCDTVMFRFIGQQKEVPHLRHWAVSAQSLSKERKFPIYDGTAEVRNSDLKSSERKGLPPHPCLHQWFIKYIVLP